MMDEELRLKALTAAQAEGLTGEAASKRADEIYKWLRYGNDGATSLRKALNAEPIETPKATIHKRPPFLDDYKPE